VNTDGAELAGKVRKYLRSRKTGALSTISSAYRGHPYTSSVAYILDERARPVFLASGLAEHSINILLDSRASLLIADADESGTQAGTRVSLLGNARLLDAQGSTALISLYKASFPTSLRLLSLGDFSFYTIEPLSVRYIGGFGQVCWLSRKEFQVPDDIPAISPLVALVNIEARDAILHMAHCLTANPTTDAEILFIDPDGVYLRICDRCLRLDFPEKISLGSGALLAIRNLADSLPAQ
jgi:hypothetical protein